LRAGVPRYASTNAATLTTPARHASWTQTLPDWIDAHVCALTAIGGVPQLIVPDDTKTAVIKACLYDPQVSRTYAEMAAHYGSARRA
jgi:transposase